MFLKDQVALVTGGSRGIGRGVVLALAKEGAKVAFVYKGNQEAADKLVAEVTTAGGTAISHPRRRRPTRYGETNCGKSALRMGTN